MTDTDERFDRVEGRLDGVEGRLHRVEGRLDGVEGRLHRVEGRLEGVEGRLHRVEGGLEGLTGQVGSLEKEIHQLRILEEENRGQIKLIAEMHGAVLEDHSRLLNQLVTDIAPLKPLPDLLRTVIRDHERRITALEQRGT